MTNKEAIEAIKSNYPPKHYSILREALDKAMEVLEWAEWIPITYRDADDEEKEDGFTYMFTCPLPEENEEVLISSGKYISLDTMCYDDGWYFDNYGDIRDVDAWMPLPKPYRSEG